jgi:hypothetical protein
VLPDRIFEAMFNDRLVAKGTMLQVITDIFKYYIKFMNGSVDELVSLLGKAKVSDRLLEYFPPGQQTEEAFKAHFEKHGMNKLVLFPHLVHKQLRALLTLHSLHRDSNTVNIISSPSHCTNLLPNHKA